MIGETTETIDDIDDINSAGFPVVRDWFLRFFRKKKKKRNEMKLKLNFEKINKFINNYYYFFFFFFFTGRAPSLLSSPCWRGPKTFLFCPPGPRTTPWPTPPPGRGRPWGVEGGRGGGEGERGRAGWNCCCTDREQGRGAWRRLLRAERAGGGDPNGGRDHGASDVSFDSFLADGAGKGALGWRGWWWSWVRR